MDPKVSRKIQAPGSLAKIVADLKKKGKKVVLCHGVFDIVHLGHIRHFNQAKEQGDVLITSVTEDKFVKRGPGRPYFNDRLRAEQLASLAMTDYVSIVEAPTATEFIRKVRPDVYAKGPDYKAKDKDVTGKILEEEEAIKSVGGRLFFTDDITFSSSKLINDYLDAYPPRTVKYLKAMAKRYSIDYIIGSLEGLKKLKVLVIGDTIVDEYMLALDEVAESTAFIETQVLRRPEPPVLKRIIEQKRQLIEFRRVASGMREVANAIQRRVGGFVGDDLDPYFRDIYDHLVRCQDMVESYRDILTGTLDIYLSAVANRTNEVMKVLTFYGTIALPLLIVTGFFGMNLSLPWAESPHGVLYAVGLMMACSLAVVIYLRRKRWL